MTTPTTPSNIFDRHHALAEALSTKCLLQPGSIGRGSALVLIEILYARRSPERGRMRQLKIHIRETLDVSGGTSPLPLP